MFAQFFWRGHPAFAWTSLVLLMAWQGYLGLFRRRLNDFYGKFYDSLADVSSGEDDVSAQLGGLCLLVLPVVVLSAPLRLLRQLFVLQWRLDLCESYTRAETWSSAKRIEGASQRVQEDTSRLAAGLSRRPPTLVCGPEIMDKYVGNSEAQLRTLFTNPPKVCRSAW